MTRDEILAKYGQPQPKQPVTRDQILQQHGVPAPAQELTGDAYDQDVAKSVLQGVRNIGEGTVALPGNVAMLAAQGMNVVARNVPSLGLKEVPQDVLENAIPGTSEDISKLTSPYLGKPYEAKTTMGKVLGTAVELAPLATSVAGIVRRAPEAVEAATEAAGARSGLRTVDELQKAKTAAYGAAKAQGGDLTENNYKFLVKSMEQAAAEATPNAELHSKALSVLNDMKAKVPEAPSSTDVKMAQFTGNPLPEASAPPGLDDVERFRQQLNQISRKSADETQQFMAGHLRDAMDEALDKVTEGNPAYAAARAANVTYKKAEAIQELVDRAERSAATTGKPFGEKLRAEFKTLANNKRRMRQFGPEEARRINEIVLGGKVETVFNNLAKSGISGRIPITILSYITGGPAGAISGPLTSDFVRQELRGFAGKATAKKAEALQRLIQKLPEGSIERRRLEITLTKPRSAAIGGTALPPALNSNDGFRQ